MTLFRFEISSENEFVELNLFERYNLVYTKNYGIGSSSVCAEYNTFDDAISNFLQLISDLLSLEKEKQNKINKSLQP